MHCTIPHETHAHNGFSLLILCMIRGNYIGTMFTHSAWIYKFSMCASRFLRSSTFPTLQHPTPGPLYHHVNQYNLLALSSKLHVVFLASGFIANRVSELVGWKLLKLELRSDKIVIGNMHYHTTVVRYRDR